MILIGQYDSPFVRRVAIALTLYDMAFEHRPWSVFGDADKIAPFNPLIRVPTLVLDSGDALIESAMILDYLDEQAGPGRALIASAGPARREALKVCALATGLADKAVALVYERVLHKEKSQAWVDRCTGQVERVLDVLQRPRCAPDAVLVRRFDRSCGHRRGVRAALCARSPSAGLRANALAVADRSRGSLRDAAGVQCHRAAVQSAEIGSQARASAVRSQRGFTVNA